MTQEEVKKFRSSRAWRDRVRPNQLRYNPFCIICDQKGKLTEATEVDHIIPMEMGGDSFSPDNLQSLCKRCHVLKSAQEVRERNLRRKTVMI